MTNSRSLLRLQLNDMPNAPSIAESSQDLVLSERPQLLIVCLLLGLLLCGGIVLYTNQVKGKAALLAQDSYSGGPAADMIPPSSVIGSSPVLGTAAIDRSQPSDASLNARRNKQPGIATNHQSATEHGGRNELASQKAALSKPGSRKVSPTPAPRGNVSLSLLRSRSRSSLPGHHRTTLVALWRQSLKRHQNDKLSHLTSNPST
jgi:hypothetical protein